MHQAVNQRGFADILRAQDDEFRFERLWPVLCRHSLLLLLLLLDGGVEWPGVGGLVWMWSLMLGLMLGLILGLMLGLILGLMLGLMLIMRRHDRLQCSAVRCNEAC